ncbi:hypothetical protein WKV44_10470 [Spirochaetia bacterium 38H-sp]|uniref:Uncharacterized protein n=1 Tax=Rarispira pelagica TaxID=3141764 RepID=A0ABU9UEI5_9SPIR
MYSFGDYKITDLAEYNELSDMPYLESQAQMVGDFALLYYKARYGSGLSNAEQKVIREMSRILQNSGILSEAVTWVSENL